MRRTLVTAGAVLLAAGCSFSSVLYSDDDAGTDGDAAVGDAVGAAVDTGTTVVAEDTPRVDTGYSPCAAMTAVDPAVFSNIADGALVALEDDSMLGGMVGVPDARLRVAAVAAVPVSQAGENCVLYATAQGGTARAGAPTLNYGGAVFTQGALSATLAWTAGPPAAYLGDPSGLAGLVSGMPVTVALAGGPDGPAGMASLVFPPVVSPTTFSGGISGVSTAMPVVVTWVPPTTDPGADLVAFYQSFDQGNYGANMVLCAVPACAGQLTVPAALRAVYASGTTLQVTLGFGRTALVAPASASRPVHFTAGSTVVYTVATP